MGVRRVDTVNPIRGSGRRRSLPRRIARWAGALVLGAFALCAAAFGALAWWLHGEPTQRMLARVGEVASVELVETTHVAGAVITDEVLTSTTGLRVHLRTKRPADVASRSGTTLLILGGLERGRFAVDLIDDLRGHTVAALDYPYEGPKRKVRAREIVARFGELRQALLDTPPAALLARRHLAAQEYVDPGRIELVGASLGGIFVCYAGALDDEFDRVWTLHAGGDIDRLIVSELERKLRFAPVRRAIAWIPRYMLGGYGPEAFVGRIAPRPYVMVCATGDERIPRGSVERLFAAAGEPKQLIWVDGLHLDGDDPQSLEPILAAMFERLGR
jgi:dienelactone hydrolase